MKGKKFKALTAMALALSMVGSSVMGGSTVFASGGGQEEDITIASQTDAPLLELQDNGIQIQEDTEPIVVSEPSESEQETPEIQIVEEEPLLKASVTEKESGIKISEEQDTDYSAGDTVSLDVKAENRSEDSASFRLYFWDYEKKLPEDTDKWGELLVKPCADVTAKGFDENGSFDVELQTGKQSQDAEVVWKTEESKTEAEKDAKMTARYLEATLPAESTLSFNLDLVSEKADHVTVVPMMVAKDQGVYFDELPVCWMVDEITVVEVSETEADATDVSDIPETDKSEVEMDKNTGNATTSSEDSLLIELPSEENMFHISEFGGVEVKTILGFSEIDNSDIILPNKISLSELSASYLPKQLQITLSSGLTETINTTWVCFDDYDNTHFDLYTFELTLPEGYVLDSDVELPYINVYISSESSDKETRVGFDAHPNLTLTLDKKLGCTKDIGQYLQDMYDRDKAYYVGTPYNSNVFQEPYTNWMLANGETSDRKSGHMNCTGFVGNVIQKCGGNVKLISNRRTGWYINASNWHDFANGYTKQANGTWQSDVSKSVKSYKFSSVQAALNSGILEKGDILYFEPLNWNAPGADCHIGFFFGNTPSDNKFWHSSTHPSVGNQISAITPKVPSTLYVYKTYHAPKKGGLSIQKESANPDITNGNSNYSLEGAEYTVYSDAACTKVAYRMRTNSTGYAYTGDTSLTEGTYYVKETIPSKGYDKDPNTYTYQVKGGQVASANKKTSKEPPKTGHASLVKVSSLPDMTNDNGCYSLEGAVYGIWKSESCSGTPWKTMKTDTNGNAKIDNLPFGTYYVKETQASQGFELDIEIHKVTVTEASPTKTINSTEVPGNDPMGISITKIWDGEQTPTIPSLAGTQFTVKYYDNMKKNTSGAPKRKWVIEVKYEADVDLYMTALTEDYLVRDQSDPLYKQDGMTILPYGTYSIQETKPAPAYTLNGVLKDENGHTVCKTTEPYVTVVDKNGAIELQGGNEYTGYNTPVDTSIKILKKDGDGKPLAGVTFELTNSKGEVVGTATTDSSGVAHFKNLYPDRYTVTETKTASGHTLLKEPFVIETPTRVTEAQINEYHIDRSKVTFDPAENIYYIFDLTYEVTNGPNIILPMTGAMDTPWMYVPLALGLSIFAGLGIVVFRRKKHQK